MKNSATIEMVAQACGVSKGTVSKALNPHRYGTRVSLATIERIRQTASRLGYFPDFNARMRARKKTWYIGLTCSGYAPLTQGVYEMLPEYAAFWAMKAGYQLLFIPGQGDRELWERMLSNHRLDGLLATDVSPELESYLQTDPIPCVLINEAGQGRLSRVLVRESIGAEALVHHLHDLGHRHIAFCHFKEDQHFAKGMMHYSYQMRLDSFRSAMQQVGSTASEYIGQSAAHFIEKSFRHRQDTPTALIFECHDDARAFLLAAKPHGISVPNDVSIACFNHINAMEWSSPTITSIDIPLEAMVRNAISILIEAIDGNAPDSPQTMWSDPRILLGESTVRCVHPSLSPLPIFQT